VPGLEVLDVPIDVALTPFNSPHTVVPNVPFPNQSIIFPSVFDPRVSGPAASLDGFSFFGNVFHGGMASAFVATFGELGQIQGETPEFVQSINIPNFRAIFQPVFNDTVSPTTPIPPSFGARRTSFNFYQGAGIFGVFMCAAVDDEMLLQPTGLNVYAALGLVPPLPSFRIPLPSDWITTTEILSF